MTKKTKLRLFYACVALTMPIWTIPVSVIAVYDLIRENEMDTSN